MKNKEIAIKTNLNIIIALKVRNKNFSINYY